MHKIQFGKIERQFPESISEMTPEQYQYFCFMEMRRQLNQVSMEQVEVALVYKLLNMVRTSRAQQVVENVNQLRTLVRPYYLEQRIKGKVQHVVDLNFVINPLPTVECNGLSLMGPKAALADCSYGEVFLTAQPAMVDFVNNGDEDALDRLVATLYRPEVKGKRPAFKDEELEENVERVKDLYPEIKFGIYLFFASCQKFIVTNTDLDIGGGVTVDIAALFKPDPRQGKRKGVGPVGIIYSLAESGVFGNARETAAENVYDVLIRMVQLDEQAKKMKQDAKRK